MNIISGNVQLHKAVEKYVYVYTGVLMYTMSLLIIITQFMYICEGLLCFMYEMSKYGDVMCIVTFMMYCFTYQWAGITNVGIFFMQLFIHQMKATTTLDERFITH